MAQVPPRAVRRERQLRRASEVIGRGIGLMNAIEDFSMTDAMLSTRVDAQRLGLMSQRTALELSQMQRQAEEKERKISEHLAIARPLLERALRGERVNTDLLMRKVDLIEAKHEDLELIYDEFIGLLVMLRIRLIERLHNRQNRRILE